MIDVIPTKEMRDEARRRGAELGIIKGSIMQGEGNEVGFLGKLLVARFLSVDLDIDYDHDMVLGTTRIEVKSKNTKVVPQPDHECSVWAANTTQKCDWYVFVRALEPHYRRAWILGYLTPMEYMAKAVFIHRGWIDPRNGWECRADCYNVPISELHPLRLPDNRPQPGGWW